MKKIQFSSLIEDFVWIYLTMGGGGKGEGINFYQVSKSQPKKTKGSE
jgi:hypothetical protein